MTRRTAGLASAAFALAGPGLELGLGPYLLTSGFETGDPPAVLRAAGAVLLGVALLVVAWCFAGFVRDGLGSPSPLAPPGQLVRGGPYAHVRNPMYVATTAGLAGEAALLGRPVLLIAAAAYLTALALQVRLLEEPRLRKRFGADWDAYVRTVPGWLPRLG